MYPYRLLLLFLFLQPNVFSQSRSYTDSLTGIVFIFNTESNMFPSSWNHGKIKGKAVSLDTAEFDRTIKVLKTALRKYPAQLLEKTLEKIYVMNSLNFYGVNYGGTNTTEKLYLANSGIINGYTDEFIERTFHHEFSSILLEVYPNYFDKEKWKQVNRPDFAYGCVNGYEAIESGNASEKFEDKYNRMGFLTQYATSTLENDLNTFSENIFKPKENFWVIVQNHEKLDAKLRLVVDFYSKIDSTFTFDYFLNMLIK